MSERTEAIKLTGITKEYRLGEIGSGTLQGDIKEWRERRKNKGQVTKRKGSFLALDHIDLTVYEGEALGIIGHNGAGKSTMLKLISRITAPTEGTIDIRGRVTSMLEVGAGFHGEMTGRENIYLNGAILGMSRKEIDAKMDEIIQFAEVADFIDTPVKRYSSGMYVKLAFSVAAHLDSEIMITDEVLAVGDAAFQKKCIQKMRSEVMQEGKTVLYVSHNMSTVRDLCTRCIVLDHGKIVFDGDTEAAIAMYTGLGSSDTGVYHFDESYRPYDKYVRKVMRLNIDSLSLGRQDNSFRLREHAHITVSCTAVCPLTDVRFRFEFWYQDGVKVGSMLSGNGVDMHEGKNTVSVDADLSHLAAGQYRADLVAYQMDEHGTETILDGVYPGMILNLTDDAASPEYIDWHGQYWGAVRLNDLQLQEEEAS